MFLILFFLFPHMHVLLHASLSSFGAGRVYRNQPDQPEPVTLVGGGDSEVQRLHAHTHLTPLVSRSLEVIPPCQASSDKGGR